MGAQAKDRGPVRSASVVEVSVDVGGRDVPGGRSEWDASPSATLSRRAACKAVIGNLARTDTLRGTPMQEDFWHDLSRVFTKPKRRVSQYAHVSDPLCACTSRPRARN